MEPRLDNWDPFHLAKSYDQTNIALPVIIRRKPKLKLN